MTGPWQIELLGWLRATLGDRVVTRFRTRQAEALLAYLAYHPERSHRREELIELLWPGCDADSGRNRLSLALSSLRHALEVSGFPDGACILADRLSVRLNPRAFSTDVQEFDALLQEAARCDDTAERVRCLARAARLYRGELLAGQHDAWVLQEREWLAERYFQVVRELVGALEAMGDPGSAFEVARRAVRIDPLREEGHRALMRLYAITGQPEAALRQYATLERLLSEELSATPDAQTRALLREIAAAPGRTEESHGATIERSREPLQTAVSPAEFSAPAPTPAPTGHLPLQFTRFFGREEEIVRLQELLLAEEVRLVTLTGPGGSGKTRLALAAAARLTGAGAALSPCSAAWFVPLVDLADPRLIPDRTLDGLHLPRSPNQDPQEQVVAALARHPSVLLLDNLEHLLPDGAAFVATLLERVATLTVLATSRQRLGLPGEREVPVPPLPVPDPLRPEPDMLLRCPSVQLFVDRAQSVRPDFQMTERSAAAIAELCGRLEGLPLAIELAAARAWVLTPAQMLERLSHRFELLSRRQYRGEARHRSLRAALDWSYELLPPELQRFFARLTVFRGGWTLAAAEAVCAEPQALDYLEQLRECSLILAEEAAAQPTVGHGPQGGHPQSTIPEMRFRMLETLREYAQEQLDPEEVPALRRQAAAFYLALAEEAEPKLGGPEQRIWLNRLDAERENVRAALGWPIEAGPSRVTPLDVEVGLRLGTALERFWHIRACFPEAWECLTTLLSFPEAAVRTTLRSKALHIVGYVSRHRGDLATSHALSEESLAIGREIGDRSRVAWALLNLGSLPLHQGEFAAARVPLEESLSLQRELGDRRGIAWALHGLGDLAHFQGDLVVARARYEESLAIWRELGDQRASTITRHSLATVLLLQSDNPGARALLEENLTIQRTLADSWGIARSLYGLGNIARDQDDRVPARALYGESLAIRRAVGDRRGMADSLYELGILSYRQEQYPSAHALLVESLTLFYEAALNVCIGRSLEGLARVASGQGQFQRAARLFGAAQALFDAARAGLGGSHRADHERRVTATRWPKDFNPRARGAVPVALSRRRSRPGLRHRGTARSGF